jgi:hypothetical protein
MHFIFDGLAASGILRTASDGQSADHVDPVPGWTASLSLDRSTRLYLPYAPEMYEDDHAAGGGKETPN